jgi:N utilization substance protein B
MKHQRRRARSLALQALYEIDCVRHDPELVIERTLAGHPGLGEDGAQYLRRTVHGVLENARVLDEWIRSCAPEWPVDELAVLDRNILRVALWEFRWSEETPVKVAINEAVELAKRYSSDNAPRFINGVLGSLAVEA